jgi:GNAT superfamily N-acetyltransferase
MIRVEEVITRKQRRAFLSFPLKLYKGVKGFVPLLYMDEKKIFDPNYFYYDGGNEAIRFLAYDDKKVVGRIEGILSKVSNDKWHQKRIRFDRFDTIDDPAVTKALFGAIENWGKSKGMEEVCGPLGFSDMDREGLLIEGFDEVSTYEEQYNYPYYQKLIEDLGYQKEVDWTERKIYAPETIDPKIGKIADAMMKKLNLRYVTYKTTKELLKNFGEEFFDIVDATYKDIYMTVPFTPKQRASMISSFQLVLRPENFAIIANEKGECVAFGMCFPSLSKALVGSGGHLTPIRLIRLLHAINHPRILDFGLIGVRPDYRNTGIEWSMLFEAMHLLKGRIEYAETNLNLEDNHEIQNTWNRFKTVQHKRRRSYVKKIA